MRRLLTLVLLPSLIAFGIVLMPTSAGAAERQVPTIAKEVTASVTTAKTVSLQGGEQSVAAYWRGNPGARVTLAFSADGTHFEAPIDADRDEVGLQRRGGVTYGAIHDARGARAVRVVTDRPLARLTIVRLADGAATTQRTLAATAAQAASTQPAVIPRSGWGADPAYMTWAPQYAPTKKLIVHHTATTNDYVDRAAAEAQIRIIYYYHAVLQLENGKPWGDIGYNFVIDRFGNVYEGRYSRPYNGANPTGDDVYGNGVTGAHTDGWNTGTVGIALLGTFTTQDVTLAAHNALKSLLAWEASRHGINPAATTPYVNPVSHATILTANIASHLDYMSTDCPGAAFYAKLPLIRTEVAAQTSVPAPAKASLTFSPRDFTGDGKPDVMRVTSAGYLYLYRGNGVGGFSGSGARIGTGWGGYVSLLSPGDFTGDRRSDILGVKGNGELYLFRGNGTGGFSGSATRIGSGWGGYLRLFSPGDFTGDRRSDILGVKGNGELYLFRGNGTGGFSGSATRIGFGWGGFTRLFSPGDFTGDGKADIVGVKSTGEMYLYRGNGLGAFTGSGVKIGVGWGSFVTMLSPGDFSGDGKADMLAIRSTGELYLYRGNGLGAFTGSGVKIGTGWS